MEARCEKSTHLLGKILLPPCSSCLHGNPRKVSLSKIKKGDGKRNFVAHVASSQQKSITPWFVVCYSAGKNLGKTSILFWECQGEGKQFKIQSVALSETQILLFP